MNITCTVESYPSADKAINYKLIHSQADPIQIQILPSGKGIYHTIDSASKEQDAGKYECVVSLSLDEYPNSTLQSDRAEASLTVYGELIFQADMILCMCISLVESGK